MLLLFNVKFISIVFVAHVSFIQIFKFYMKFNVHTAAYFI